MATIALYADRINQMPALIGDAKKAVDGLRSQLDILKRKCEAVDTAVCDLDDVISTISASTETQGEKTAMLETFGTNVEQFARDASVIDDRVADQINGSKDDFYDKYSYLKPDCEKSGWEKFCDGCKKVGQWCKEHWKAITTAVLVVAAIAVVVLTAGAALGPVTALLLAAAKGILIGTVVGGLAGGTASALFGGSFWEGFEDGAFGGAISGMFSGVFSTWISLGLKLTWGRAGLQLVYSGGSRVALTCLQTVIVNSVAEGFSSIIGDFGDIVFGVDQISIGKLVFNAAFSATLAALFSKVVYDIPEIPFKGVTKGRGSWAAVWSTQSIRSLRHHSIISINTILKGLGADFSADVLMHISELIKNLISVQKDNYFENKAEFLALAGGSVA